MIKSKTLELEYFIAVVDSGSFSAAATMLDQQVAKISRAIARLEKELDITLFNRTTRRVELTEEGHVFFNYAKRAIQVLTEGEETLNNLKGEPRGKLRIDAASPFLYHQIIPHIQAFAKQYPEINIELISNESIVDLIEKKTDVAIRIGKLSDSNLYAKKLGNSKLRMVASPDYLARHSAPKNSAELSEHNLIGFVANAKLNNWHLRDAMTIKPSICASNGESIRQLVLAGNGIAVLSNFMVSEDIANGRLVELLPGSISSPNPREEIHAVYYRNSAVSSRISVFLSFFAKRMSL